MALPFDLAVNECWQSDVVTPSTISAVYASPDPGLGGDRVNITNAWVGAAFDSLRKDILLIGGGHAAYHGNEIYAQCLDPLSANFLKWRIKNFYSTPTTNAEENADGTPTSIHSYCCLPYNATRDVLTRMPGCSPDTDAGTFTARTYEYDCTVESPTSANAGAWTQKTDAPGGEDISNGLAAYDPQTGLVYKPLQTSFRLHSFNGGTNAWTSHGSSDFVPESAFNSCSAIGVTGGISYFATCGGGSMQVMRMDNFTMVGSASDFGATGDTAIEAANSPGLGWDTNSERLCAWAGGNTLYRLNLATKVWSAVTITGDTLPSALANGTYTRWQPYTDGLFTYVHNTTTPTFFVRVSESQEEPSEPAAVPSGLGAGQRIKGIRR